MASNCARHYPRWHSADDGPSLGLDSKLLGIAGTRPGDHQHLYVGRPCIRNNLDAVAADVWAP